MRIIVQKFGGTSVATPESRKQVVQKIKKAIADGYKPVVVVSAIGRKGAPYATDTLIDFVNNHAGEMTPHSYDLLLSCGEIISAVIMTTLLAQDGIVAKAFTGGQAGIITDAYHQKADLLSARPEALLATLEEGMIPVVAGFQGMTLDGEITTLGRGGSDTSAAMLGASVKAERIEIFTDVDGIMTADPNVCEKAKIIPAISYMEVFQMADSGAKVIHPRAVEYAMRANIPLVIKNTFSDEPGTYILSNVENLVDKDKHQKVITSVAHRYHRTQFTIHEPYGKGENLLSAIADAGISIDLINIFPHEALFTVDEVDEKALCQLLTSKGYKYEIVPNCAKVTVIGERMTGVPGVMARIVYALNKEHIEIYQTADSLTTIACLIEEKYVSKAIGALHDEFRL
ncbi:MAG: aspartate kinase [Cellulosilyticum sp.]|nr:aspartate kinase [Cellulosilyticum sp.]